MLSLIKPIAGSLLHLQKKTVEIINFSLNKEVINVHCSNSEDDLGLKHIACFQWYSFKFRVNWKGTRKFRCHVTRNLWALGQDNFLIFFLHISIGNLIFWGPYT